MTFSKTILCLSSFLMLPALTSEPVAAQAPTASAAAPVAKAHIEWQESTLRLIHQGGLYGRVARVDE
ncbi:MAG: hypothetical protein KY445_14915, partial [Armatimonadetes bacterium]|nr:hypothetical protein [Armatimonadota bacterium]